jgi:tetrahydromethanopterin S-methyltransferase subunit D
MSVEAIAMSERGASRTAEAMLGAGAGLCGTLTPAAAAVMALDNVSLPLASVLLLGGALRPMLAFLGWHLRGDPGAGSLARSNDGGTR